MDLLKLNQIISRFYYRLTGSLVASGFCILFFSACATHLVEEPALPQRGVTREPSVRIDPESGEHVMEISVLTYNVAGLPWPVRSSRGKVMERIGRYLGDLRARGQEPDIVLLQEAFIGKTRELISATGYPNFTRGPEKGDRAPLLENERAEKYKRKKHRLRGEGWKKWTHSGLYILSNFPIEEKKVRPYRYCAGWDCLANKGVVLARITIPGLPRPLDIFNTHLNSRGSAGVSEERSHAAHNLQIDELDQFLDNARNIRNPLIFGGDFNTSNARERIRHVLEKDRPYMIVSYYCIEVVDDCEILLSFDGDEPWLSTQDMQGFAEGEGIRVRPVRIEAMFDGPNTGGKLSDHDGYLVHYELRWRPGAKYNEVADNSQ